MAFSLTPSTTPVVVANSVQFGDEASKQYDELYPAGTNRQSVGLKLADYLTGTGPNDPAAEVKAALEELAATANALAARIITA